MVVYNITVTEFETEPVSPKEQMLESTAVSEKTQEHQSEYEKNAIISVSLSNDNALVSFC